MRLQPTRCFISLGSNLHQPGTQLDTALRSLEREPGITLTRVSPRYGSRAVGPGEQPDYVNAVAELHTTLAPLALLDRLQTLEHAQGRVREQRWGARTLDLDILLYGDRVIDEPRLTVPHPHLSERPFVVVPLYDLAPQLHLPDGTSLASLLDYAGTAALWPLPDQGD